MHHRPPPSIARGRPADGPRETRCRRPDAGTAAADRNRPPQAPRTAESPIPPLITPAHRRMPEHREHRVIAAEGLHVAHQRVDLVGHHARTGLVAAIEHAIRRIAMDQATVHRPSRRRSVPHVTKRVTPADQIGDRHDLPHGHRRIHGQGQQGHVVTEIRALLVIEGTRADGHGHCLTSA
ncbi:Hypothetical protein Blongum51A_1003 [Bifidobacterium longum]|nr:Hypothetical protein Blongum51A_1003 [Bifidobacterium longum]